MIAGDNLYLPYRFNSNPRQSGMIVSCPACQTQFNVDPALLGPGGRKVRCAKCAHVWRVGQNGKSSPTGQFGLHAPGPAAAKSAAPADVETGTDVRTAPDTPEESEAPGTEEPGPPAEKPSLWARELIEREETAKLAAGSAEAAEGPGQDTQEGEAADAAISGLSTAADAKTDGADGAAASQEVRQSKRRKGGRKFKIFLLLLCLVVLGLLAATVLTGQFRPGGIAPAPQGPSTGDVTPPVLPGPQ
jgi:predicted Zn finger-like uncharacterized protein